MYKPLTFLWKKKSEWQGEIWNLSWDRKLQFPWRKAGVLRKEVGVTHRPVASLWVSVCQLLQQLTLTKIPKMVMTVTQQACSISEPTETFPSSMLTLGANVHMHTSPVRSWWGRSQEHQAFHKTRPSSHRKGWRQLLVPTLKTDPGPGNIPATGPGGGVPLAGTGSCWTSAKDNYLRPRGLRSASPYQLLTFMGPVD